MEFKKLNEKIKAQFTKMCDTGKLFKSSIIGKQIKNLYLGSFTKEEDPVFRDPESTSHTCNNDTNFLKRYGNIVAMEEQGDLLTMFDIEIEFPYKNVMNI